MSRRIRNFYEFGPFRLDAEKLSLWRDGEPVPITPKAAETLIVLIQQNGKLVEREALMSAIWPDTFVEDGNLNFNVSMLRKALGTDETGEQYIETIPRHGYRFRAAVQEITEDVPALVVEKHTRARVVIQEQELPAPLEWEAERPQLLPALLPRKKWIYLAGISALAVVAVVAWFRLNRQPLTMAGAPPIQSIAVLPLKPLNNDEADRILCAGLTDTLVTRLGSLRTIVVRPALAVNPDAESAQDPIEIGSRLKVDAVLAGTVQRTENRLRINARLLRVSDGVLIWSAGFDENEVDLFKLQDALAVQVRESLTSKLNTQDHELLTKHYTENRLAYHAYWRGRFLWEKYSNPDKAILEFQQAINLDRNYALAYAGLADAYTQQAIISSGDVSEFYEKARASANQALRLDPHLAEAHISLARVKYMYDWDWAAAEQSFKRALELDPNSVQAHQLYSQLLMTLGRLDEALAEIQKARELDPRSFELTFRLFIKLERRGDFDEALKVAEQLVEMDKNDPLSTQNLGRILLVIGEYAKVIDLGNQEFPDPQKTDHMWASLLATAFHKTGQAKKAAAMLNHLKQLAEKDSKALYSLAINFNEFGRTNDAFAALQKCLALREERMVWANSEPRFVAIRYDPRFRVILQKMNLPI